MSQLAEAEERKLLREQINQLRAPAIDPSAPVPPPVPQGQEPIPELTERELLREQIRQIGTALPNPDLPVQEAPITLEPIQYPEMPEGNILPPPGERDLSLLGKFLPALGLLEMAGQDKPAAAGEIGLSAATKVPEGRLRGGNQLGYGPLQMLRGLKDPAEVANLAQVNPTLQPYLDYAQALQQAGNLEAERIPDGTTHEGLSQQLRAQIEEQTKKEFAERFQRAKLQDTQSTASFRGRGLTGPKPFSMQQQTEKELKEEIERQVQMQSIPGVHRPPLSDEEVAQMVGSMVEREAAGEVEKFREEHPWIAAAASGVGQVVPYATGVGLTGGALAKLGGAVLPKVVQGGAAFAGADALVQGQEMFTGAREKFSPGQVVESAAMGGLATGAAVRIGQALTKAKIPAKYVRTIEGSANLGVDVSAESALAAAKEAVTGNPDPMTFKERFFAILGATGAGAAASGAMPAVTMEAKLAKEYTKLRKELQTREQKQKTKAKNKSIESAPEVFEGDLVLFETPEGKKIQAEVIDAQGASPVVKLESGKKATVRIDRLSALEAPEYKGKGASPKVTATQKEAFDALEAVVTEAKKTIRGPTWDKWARDKYGKQFRAAYKVIREAQRHFQSTASSKDTEAVTKAVGDSVRALQDIFNHLPGRAKPKKGEAGQVYIPDWNEWKGLARRIGKYISKAINFLKSLPRQMPGSRAYKAARAFEYAEGFMDHRGNIFGGNSGNQWAKDVRGGKVRVLSITSNTPDRIELEYTRDGGKAQKISLWNSSDTSQFQQLHQNLRKLVHDDADRAAKERASMVYLSEAARTRLPARMQKIAEHMPPVVRDVYRHLVEGVNDAAWRDVDSSKRAWLMKHMDELKSISHQVAQLTDGFDDGHHFRDALWDAYHRVSELVPEIWGNEPRVKKALELIERMRAVNNMLGQLFFESGFITEETLNKYRDVYSHWVYDTRGGPLRRVFNRKSAISHAARDVMGAESVVHPGSVLKVMHGGHFKKRKIEDVSEAKRRGLNTDFDTITRGAVDQMFAAAQLKMYDLLDNTDMVRESQRKLPDEDQEVLKRRETLVERYEKLEEYRVRERIGVEIGPEGESKSERATRGHTYRQLQTHHKWMLEHGFPTVGALDSASKAVAGRVRLAQAKYRRLSDAHFQSLRFDRIPSTQDAITQGGEFSPKVKMTDARSRRLNDARCAILEEVKEINDHRRNWVQVPDEQAYGAIRGKWIQKSVWDEARPWQAEASAFIQLFDAAHLLSKKNVTARNLGTMVKNILGNMAYLKMSGVSLSHPETVKFACVALRAVWQKYKTGEFKPTGNAETDKILQEAFDSGIMEVSAPSIEMQKLYQGWDTAKADIDQAKERGDRVDSWFHTFRGFLSWTDGMITNVRVPGTKLKPIELQEAAYHVSDPAMAVLQRLVLRTGKGSNYDYTFSRAEADAWQARWFDYQQVARFLRTPWGRRLASFARFRWKAWTGIPQAMATGPLTIVPGAASLLVPSWTNKIRKATSLRPIALGKTREMQRATTIGSAATLLAIRMSMPAVTIGWLWDLIDWSDDEEERGRTVGSWGQLVKELYQAPLTLTPNPVTLDLQGIDPSSLLMGEGLGLMEGVKRLGKGLTGDWGALKEFGRTMTVKQNVITNLMDQLYRGVNWREQAERDLTTWDAVGRFGEKALPKTAWDLARLAYQESVHSLRQTDKRPSFEKWMKSLGLSLRRADSEDLETYYRTRAQQLTDEGRIGWVRQPYAVERDDAEAQKALSFIRKFMERAGKKKKRERAKASRQ